MTDSGGKIGIDPIPPHQGDTMTVTTPGPWPQTVTVKFGSDPAFNIEVTGAGGATVQIPTNATSVKVTDPAGVLTGNGSVIEP